MNHSHKENEYQCEGCGGVFEKGWSDDEAAAESMAAFGTPTGAIVCDDCYNKLMYLRATPTTHNEPPTLLLT